MRRPKLSPICPPGWTPPAGEAVREAIRAAGWSQVGVARALGLGDRTVRQWCSERSAPNWPVWIAPQEGDDGEEVEEAVVLSVIAEVLRTWWSSAPRG